MILMCRVAWGSHKAATDSIRSMCVKCSNSGSVFLCRSFDIRLNSGHLSNRMHLWTLLTETYKSEIAAQIAIRSPSLPRVTSPAAREGAMDEPKTFFQRTPNSLKGDVNLECTWHIMTLQERVRLQLPEKNLCGSRISARAMRCGYGRSWTTEFFQGRLAE